MARWCKWPNLKGQEDIKPGYEKGLNDGMKNSGIYTRLLSSTRAYTLYGTVGPPILSQLEPLMCDKWITLRDFIYDLHLSSDWWRTWTSPRPLWPATMISCRTLHWSIWPGTGHLETCELEEWLKLREGRESFQTKSTAISSHQQMRGKSIWDSLKTVVKMARHQKCETRDLDKHITQVWEFARWMILWYQHGASGLYSHV